MPKNLTKFYSINITGVTTPPCYLTRFLYSGLLLLYQLKASSPHANAATPAKQANVILFMVLLRSHMDFYFTAMHHVKP